MILNVLILALLMFATSPSNYQKWGPLGFQIIR
jgi:hypothetical protein